MKNKFEGYGPDGKFYTDEKQYIDSWTSVLKEVEEITGWRCNGFNPGFQMIKSLGGVFTLPNSVAVRLAKINKSLKENNIQIVDE